MSTPWHREWAYKIAAAHPLTPTRCVRVKDEHLVPANEPQCLDDLCELTDRIQLERYFDRLRIEQHESDMARVRAMMRG